MFKTLIMAAMSFIKPKLPSFGFFRDALTETSGDFDIARIALAVFIVLAVLSTLTLLGIAWVDLLHFKNKPSIADLGTAITAVLGACGAAFAALVSTVGLRAKMEDRGKKDEEKTT